MELDGNLQTTIGPILKLTTPATGMDNGPAHYQPIWNVKVRLDLCQLLPFDKLYHITLHLEIRCSLSAVPVPSLDSKLTLSQNSVRGLSNLSSIEYGMSVGFLCPSDSYFTNVDISKVQYM